jgi:hypothetical protein
MNTSKLYWCDHCAKQVNVTLHDVTEPSSQPLGDTTWEAQIEKRCAVCANVIGEQPVVSNRDSSYLKAHADMEHEAAAPMPPAANILFTAFMRADDIGAMLDQLSTDEYRVVARIESYGGRTVVVPVKEPWPTPLESSLSPGSDVPLSYLARRQAS